MKSFGNTVKLITLAFAGIFLPNMLIMHVFFDTDVFNPVSSEGTETRIAEIRFKPGNTAGAAAVQDEEYPRSTSAAPEDVSQEDIPDMLPEGFGDEAEAETAGPDSTFFMTTGEVSFLENLSMLDKLEALSLISKVGREEADRIYDLAADGITYSEMKDIEFILKRYLDRDEMETLTNLLNKSKKQYSEAKD